MNRLIKCAAAGFAVLACVPVWADLAWVDVGDVHIQDTDPIGAWYTIGNQFYATDSFYNPPYALVHNGVEFTLSSGLSASGASGDMQISYLDFQDLNVDFEADTGLTITGYKLTVSGTVRTTGTGSIDIAGVLGNSNSGMAASWPSMGTLIPATSAYKPFSASIFSLPSAPNTSAFGTAHARFRLDAFGPYRYACSSYSDTGICISGQAEMGDAFVNINKVRLEALTAPVPEVDAHWLAIVGLGLFVFRKRGARH